MRRIAFEGQNGIDEMLERLWSRHGAVFRHLTDEQNRDACAFGEI